MSLLTSNTPGGITTYIERSAMPTPRQPMPNSRRAMFTEDWMCFNIFPISWIVLATVPGYPAAVRVWNRTGWSSSRCYPEYRGTQRVRGRVVTGPRFHITVPASLPPIKYLSSDCIVTWSVHRLCSFSPSFPSRSQICDLTSIRWVAIENPHFSADISPYFTAIQRILAQSQIWQLEVKEGLKLHNLCTDHVTIQSELRYLIGGKVAGTVILNRGPVPTRPRTRRVPLISGWQPELDHPVRFRTLDHCRVTRNRC